MDFETPPPLDSGAAPYQLFIKLVRYSYEIHTVEIERKEGHGSFFRSHKKGPERNSNPWPLR